MLRVRCDCSRCGYKTKAASRRDAGSCFYVYIYLLFINYYNFYYL